MLQLRCVGACTKLRTEYLRYDEHLKVTNSHLIPVLVKALQELSAKNDALEARLTTLEG